ncbi:MAG: glycine cleavage system aminomethyltransferase GcvT [Trueperaceae bacterium]
MRRTPLYETHLELGARMVDFAGFDMPLHYKGGINQEHLAVRQDVGIFDVSHMGEIRVLGPQATEFLQFATLNDPGKLRHGRGHYNMLPNDQGGLIDDLFVYREKDDEYMVVANASNTAAVLQHLKRLAGQYDVHVVDESDNWALVALQGPGAPLLLSRLIDDDLGAIKRNGTLDVNISGVPARLSRTGYTGEDGFEIFSHPNDVVALWQLLVSEGAIPCGLGARDTLRLEAGFPLFGHEFDENSNPLCTPFGWVVKDKPFYGREAMWDADCGRRLVGIRLLERGIPRADYKVLHGGEEVGVVTSGALSPLTRDAIAFAWVRSDLAQSGQELGVEIRGQSVAAQVVDLPFNKA